MPFNNVWYLVVFITETGLLPGKVGAEAKESVEH
jgi:hypothetical protein